MKKLLFAGLTLSLVLLVFACNQKDDLAVQNDNTNLEFTDFTIPGLEDMARTDIPYGEEEYIITYYNDGDIPVDEVNAREYCRYVIVTANGPGCGNWGRNTIICVDCPAGGQCPGVDPPAFSNYRLVDHNGNTLCRGQWARSINLQNPGGCIRGCPGGQTGYVFI